MAGVRSVWKGNLKLGLVMVPCRMIAAADASDKVRFNNLHGKCGSRVQSKAWCPVCSVELERGADTARGYEIRPGEYVRVSDDELDAISDEASSMLDVSVVSDESIDPVYIDGTLYLVPSEEAGTHQAFETLRQALGSRMAIGNVVIRKKACLVVLQAAPSEPAFFVYKLRSSEQVRTFEDLELPPLRSSPNSKELSLARQLIDGMVGSFSYETVRDEYTARLRSFLSAKDAGEEIAIERKKPVNVLSLADALEASLKATRQITAIQEVVVPKPAKQQAKAELSKKRVTSHGSGMGKRRSA